MKMATITQLAGQHTVRKLCRTLGVARRAYYATTRRRNARAPWPTQPAELAAIFRGKGVNLSRPVTSICGSGITAAVVSLALELVGASEVALYDGSWAEYAAHPQAKIGRSGTT